MQTDPRHVGSFSWVSMQFPGMMDSATSVFPIFRQKTIKDQRALFRARAFKLIMDERESLSFPRSLLRLFFAPRGDSDPWREKRERMRVRWERKHASQGDHAYIQREWMDGEWAFGWGSPHKYGNFVNQVSWQSVVEFFREIESNVISQFSTTPAFFSLRYSYRAKGAVPAIWRAINRRLLLYASNCVPFLLTRAN